MEEIECHFFFTPITISSPFFQNLKQNNKLLWKSTNDYESIWEYCVKLTTEQITSFLWVSHTSYCTFSVFKQISSFSMFWINALPPILFEYGKARYKKLGTLYFIRAQNCSPLSQKNALRQTSNIFWFFSCQFQKWCTTQDIRKKSHPFLSTFAY